MILDKPYDKELFDAFLKNFLPDYQKDERPVRTPDSSILTKVIQLGASRAVGVTILEAECEETDSNKRIAITQAAFKVLRDHGIRNALVAFHDGNDQWRLSLLTSTLEIKDGKVIKKDSNPRRYSYLLGVGAKTVTPYKYLVEKGRVEDIKQLQERFSVEVVNKQFYASVAELFTKLVGGERGATKYPGLLKINSIISQNIEHQEFAVRLIGRVIFSWFLKEKKSAAGVPIVPSELLSLDAIASNADYYHSILEPLFFELLNKRVERRHESLREAPFSTVPYLNGGLFSPQRSDFYNQNSFNGAGTPGLTHIPDDWFTELFTVLEQYNFTVDENTSYDVDLSIDPEMLGRIFENLLAEINPETGESARKSTGSFYTPREIVDYMVDSSLLEFLKSKTGAGEEKLKALISWGQADDEEHPLTDDEKQKVVAALADLTILDPACGSGAFPIGILQKVVYILQQADPKAEIWLENQLKSITSPELKRDIQEKYESENYDWLRKYGVIRESIFGIDIQTIATEISKLRCFLTLIIEEEVNDEKPNRGVHALPNLDFKFVTANSLVSLPDSNAIAKSKSLNLFEDVSHIEQLKYIRNQYFSANADERGRLQVEFKNLQMDMLRSRIATGGATSDLYNTLSDWDPFSHNKTDWFDSDWMFGVDGFDIVIGNPPYVSALKSFKDNLTNRELYRKIYPELTGAFDLYVAFLLKGLQSLRTNGIYSWIIPNKLLVAKYAAKTLSRLKGNGLSSITTASLANVFDASVYPVIIQGKNGSSPLNTREYEVGNVNELSLTMETVLNDITVDGRFKTFSDGNIKISSGTTGFQAQLVKNYISDNKLSDSLPFIVSGTVDPYRIIDKPVKYMGASFGKAYIHKTDDLIAKSKWDFWKNEKIVIAGMTKSIEAVFVATPLAIGVGVYGIYGFGQYDKFLLLGLLNSKFTTYYVTNKFKAKHLSGGYLAINKETILGFPLPINRNAVIEERIASLSKKCNDSVDDSLLEEIDCLVYKLYGLTPEEISIVEGSK